MKKWLLALLLAALAAALVTATSSGQDDSAEPTIGGAKYRVDAIFDTAKGIVPGQLVKVAGARVGLVKDVQLTSGYKARIQLDVDGKFAPFRTNARCDIQPEGLISENFVQCDPGTPDQPELRGQGDQAPTVPLERTAVPINLTDLFEIWKVPVRDRLRIVLSTLGYGVAARGADLNELLRRANPTLGLVRETLQIVDGQRDSLRAAITQTRAVTRELARDPKALQDFVTSSSRVLERTARRQDDLREGLRRLPPVLTAARPALVKLEEFAADAAPLTERLGEAGPELSRLLAAVPPAAKAGRPAVRSLSSTARTGRKTVKSAADTVKRLRTFAAAALEPGGELAKLFVNLRERGFVENLLYFTYNGAASSSRFDSRGHMVPAGLKLTTCQMFAEETIEACDSNFVRTAPAKRVTAKGTPPADKPSVKAPKAPPPRLPLPLPLPKPADPVKPKLPLPEVARPALEKLLDLLLGA